MARTPTMPRDRVLEPLRVAFDAEIARSGGGVARGPGTVMITSPEMRQHANHLVNYVRDDSTLPKKIQELAMLVAARAMDCQCIWNAHAARGRREGVSDAFVDALRDRRPLLSMPADEAAVVRYGTEFFTTHKVSQAMVRAALDQCGAQGLTELTPSWVPMRCWPSTPPPAKSTCRHSGPSQSCRCEEKPPWPRLS